MLYFTIISWILHLHNWLVWQYVSRTPFPKHELNHIHMVQQLPAGAHPAHMPWYRDWTKHPLECGSACNAAQRNKSVPQEIGLTDKVMEKRFYMLACWHLHLHSNNKKRGNYFHLALKWKIKRPKELNFLHLFHNQIPALFHRDKEKKTKRKCLRKKKPKKKTR